MSEDRFAPTFQESILAALAFDDRWGKVIAGQVTANHFDEGPYRTIADKVLTYHREYHKAPGAAHVDDVFGSLLYKDGRPTQLRRVLFGLSDLAKDLNGQYVVNQVNEFVKLQQQKVALLTASERHARGGADTATDVEAIFHKALKFQPTQFEAGIFLNEPNRALAFLETREASTSPPFEIKPFDDLGLALNPKELVLFIAPKGRGKTWFCVHCGKVAAVHRGRVLHITLEVREELIAQRYFQTFMGIGQTYQDYDYTVFKIDEIEDKFDWRRRAKQPRLAFNDPRIRKIIREKLKGRLGTQLGNILIKEFPAGTLTMPKLESYLDSLVLTHKFMPTLLIVDYPDLMQIPRSDYRLALGSTFINLRGLAAERNLTVVAPTQGNRSSLSARQVKAAHVSEDVSKINTADIVITYSSSPYEQERRLARLHLAHSRTTRDNASVAITQNYALGQFVKEARLMNNSYWEKVNRESAEKAEESETEEE